MAAADIDAYDHVNNAVHMTWFDRAAWEHSAALGLPIEKCLQLDRGMAVLRSGRSLAGGTDASDATWSAQAPAALIRIGAANSSVPVCTSQFSPDLRIDSARADVIRTPPCLRSVAREAHLRHALAVLWLMR